MSLYTIRAGVTNHPEETFLQHISTVVRSGGVINHETDYLVVEPDGGGLNVDVSVGKGYLKGAISTYPIRNTSVKTVAIDPNTSGNPRITSIVAVVDLSVDPGDEDEGTDVHLLVAVNGTPASSPVAPDDGAIQSAVGGANPWIRLADVEVAHNATGISTANITDRRNRVYFQNPSPLKAQAFNSSYVHDYARSNQVGIILTGNITINTPTNMQVGDVLLIRLTQDGTGGRTVSFGSGINAKAPDVDPNLAANKVTVYGLHKVADGSFDLYLVGKDYD